MRLIVLKLAVSSAIILAYPFINFALAVFIDATFVHPVQTLIQARKSSKQWLNRFKLISRRFYIQQKICLYRDRAIVSLSNTRTLILYVALLAVIIWLYFRYIQETDELFAAIQLTTLSFIPFIPLAVHTCKSKSIARLLNCHICGWMRWALLITWLWAAHTDASDHLSSQFGAASPHLTSAYGAAAFMSAIAFLSIPSAMIVVMVEAFFFALWMTLSMGKGQLPKNKNYVAFSTIAAGWTVMMFCNQAQWVVGLSDTRNLLTGYFAWQFDMLDASACADIKTNKGSPRKIVYIDPAQNRAFLFMYPLHDKEYLDKNKIAAQSLQIRNIHGEAIKRFQPINLGVIECKYPAPSLQEWRPSGYSATEK
jgi:hypothetical protein